MPETVAEEIPEDTPEAVPEDTSEAVPEAEAADEEALVAAEAVDAEHRVVEIEADAFSIYALVVTQTIEKLYIDAEGTSWRITVGYGPDAGISADAALEVREVEDPDCLAQAQRLLPEDEQLSQARFFDITIVDGGEAVQPAAPVNVCVALADAPEGIARAVHFGEDGAELLDAQREEDGIVFDAERFSTYGLIHYPDTIQIHVEKTWSRDTEKVLDRPTSIKVQLYKTTQEEETSAVGQQVTLSESNSWSYTWKDQEAQLINEENKIATRLIYTVREVDASGNEAAPLGYVVANGDGATDESPKNGDTVERTITNTYTTGSLKVKKTVESDVADDRSYPFHFRVRLGGVSNGKYDERNFHPENISAAKSSGETISFNNNGVAEFTLAHDESAEITDLPIGMTYAVVEYDDSAHPFLPNFTTEKTGDTGTISTTQSVATFTNTRKKGELDIRKTVSDTNRIDGDHAIAFDFTVTLTAPAVTLTAPAVPTLNMSCGNISYQIGTYQTVDGEETFVPAVNGSGTFSTYRATIQLRHGQVVKITGIPVGTSYAVTEAGGDFEQAYAINGQTKNAVSDSIAVRGDTGETDSVVFTNTRKTRALKLKKVVDSNAVADSEKAYAFDVTLGSFLPETEYTLNVAGVDGTYTSDEDGTITIDDVTLTPGANYAAEIGNIPVGVGYSVVEDLDASVRDLFKEPDTDGQGTISVIDDQSYGALAQCTNTRRYGKTSASATTSTSKRRSRARWATRRWTLSSG